MHAHHSQELISQQVDLTKIDLVRIDLVKRKLFVLCPLSLAGNKYLCVKSKIEKVSSCRNQTQRLWLSCQHSDH